MTSSDAQSGYPRISVKRKTGDEKFRKSGKETDLCLLEFWQWNSSDLISNATRGCLAEFIVANALGLADQIRDEWRAFDLLTQSDIKIEVKSAAYLQSWYHKELSKIIFSIRGTRAWDPDTNQMATELKRQADVYVFCLLNHREQDEQFDPMNLDLWGFYVVPARLLNEKLPNAKTITLKTLEAFSVAAVNYDQLGLAVERCKVTA